MNKPKRFSPGEATTPNARQAGLRNPPATHTPHVARPAALTARQQPKQPVAPPAFRPPKAPQALQRHAALKQTPTPAQAKQRPAAPPVYRPQPTPKVLQRKAPQGQASNAPPKSVVSRPSAPPVYRPQPAPRVLQTKAATPGQTAAGKTGNTPAAPPVYRPQPAPRVLQRKAAAAAPAPACRPHAPVIQRASKKGHQPFHDNLLTDVGTKAFDFGGGKTVFHKISQSYLKHFSDELDTAVASATDGIRNSATRFRNELKGSKHKNIHGDGTFVMLNNMPMNLEIGPPAEDVRADQGSLFDGNTTEVQVPVPPGPPRLERRLTPRSEELKKISDLIQNNVLKGQTLTEQQWDEATVALTAARGHHHALTGNENVMTDPIGGMWVKVLNKDGEWEGLWDKHKTAEMEREYVETGSTPIEEAASRRRALDREAAEKRKEELKIQERAEEERWVKYLALRMKVDKVLRGPGITKTEATEILNGVAEKTVIFMSKESKVIHVKAEFTGLIESAFKSKARKKKGGGGGKGAAVESGAAKLRKLVIDINTLFG